MIHYCYICYAQTDPEWICETCDEHYCEDCSYTFSLHYQFQGSQCYQCADQYRREKLDMRDVRINQILSKASENIREKIQKVRKLRKGNRYNVTVSTRKINVTVTNEIVQNLESFNGFDIVSEMESQLVRDSLESFDKDYINRIFNI